MQLLKGEHLRNDIIGGLVSAGVAIPLAMGYGMFAFVALGNQYFPDGALAGLVTAVVVGIACVALGDKSSSMYAPRVTTTFFIGILLYNLVHSDLPALKAGGIGLIIPAIFAIILLGGVFQALFGLARLGTLIKHTPQPVMAGFQTAAALLLILVQLGNVFGFDKSTSFVQCAQGRAPRPAAQRADRAGRHRRHLAVAALPAEGAADRRRPAGRHRPLLRLRPGRPRQQPRADHRQRPVHLVQGARISRSSPNWRAAPGCCRSCRPSSAARWRSPSSPRSTRCCAPSCCRSRASRRPTATGC